jgi:hypothetical protein
MVVLATNEAGKHVEDVTGAHQIAFDAGDEQTITAMGYPAVGFDGRRLASCTGPGSSYSPLIVPMLTVGCYFGGMSGGPFLAGLGTGGTGTLVAVYYGAGPDFTRSYGAYFDEQERAVFEAVRRDGPVDAYVPIGGRTMFDTGIQIQNLDTVRDAHVNVEWVDNPGDEPASASSRSSPRAARSLSTTRTRTGSAAGCASSRAASASASSRSPPTTSTRPRAPRRHRPGSRPSTAPSGCCCRC